MGPDRGRSASVVVALLLLLLLLLQQVGSRGGGRGVGADRFDGTFGESARRPAAVRRLQVLMVKRVDPTKE